jgi:redox-sensing transcriptional repressor
VADRLVAAGVTSILNFAPTVLTVPDHVDVRKVDLSIELQILAYHEQRKTHSETNLVPGGVDAGAQGGADVGVQGAAEVGVQGAHGATEVKVGRA